MRASTVVPPVSSLSERAGPRCCNEYVDTPRARPPVPLKSLIAGGPLSPPRPARGLQHGGNNNLHQFRASSVHVTNTTSSSPSPILVVSHQPLSKSPALKDVIPLDGFSGCSTNNTASTTTTTTNAASRGADHAGIMCEECGKCRCRSCTERKDLPCSAWCCGGKYELSPGKALDICTCFCAVKCVFYHCRRGEEEDDDNECYENPCGCCSTPRCCPRWTVLGLMSACLPCLCTYWPARACLAASNATYNACRRHKGCQCDVTSANTGTLACSSGGHSTKSSVLSSVRGGGSGGGGGGNVAVKNSKHSQARRLLIESDSSSA